MTVIRTAADSSVTASPKPGFSYLKAGKYALALAGMAMLSPVWRTVPSGKPDFRVPTTATQAQKDEFLKQHQGIPLQPLNQNCTNACGTTALAMALNSLAAIERQDPDFQPLRHGDLDPGNRELDGFSAPAMLVRVAEEHGAHAQMINNSSFEDIEKHVSQGHPVIALMSVNRAKLSAALHYVVIFKTDNHPDKTRQTITYADPGRGTTETVNYRRFTEKSTSHLALGKYLPTGFNRFIIAFSSKNDLGPHREVPVTNLVATGVSNLINNMGMLSRATQDSMVKPVYAWLNPAAPQPVAPEEAHTGPQLASR